jgi:large subunit ribosomal protein L6
MSKIWKLPVKMLSWVSAKLEWEILKITWPKWNLEIKVLNCVEIEISDKITVSRKNDESFSKAAHWLTRSLINNMVIWVSKWFEKNLEIIWVWYRANIAWTKLNLSLWFSHPIIVDIPEWIKVVMDEKNKNIILISWINKQQVWQFAAEIREYRKPEPYKWKWVRYVWEYVRRKAW